jgi:PAS domain S-box-containing protein
MYSNVYRSWLNKDKNLKYLQKKLMNIMCLTLIAVNLLVSLLYIDASYQFYGIVSLVTLSILLVCKSTPLHLSRWIFISGVNCIIFIFSIIIHQSTLPLLFILSIPISFFLFAKDEIVELGISLTIPALFFIGLQIPGLYLQSGENLFSELFHRLFFINICCVLLSVLLAVVYLFFLYEKSNKKLRLLVRELQHQEKEITLQNQKLITLNADLIRSQKELKENEHFLHTIIDNLPVMLFVKDAEQLNLLRINKTGQRLLNSSEQELQKQSTEALSILQHWLNHQTDSEILRKGEITEQEEEVTNKNNETFILQTKKVPIYDNNGKPLYLLGISEDITRRKLAEEELKRTVAELKIRNHELDNYVYRVSHDLRAPFCSMQGLINLSKAEQDTAVLKTYIEMIEKSVNKSDRFIQSLLNHTKILNTDLQVSIIEFKKIIQESFEEACATEGIDSISLEMKINSKPFYSDAFRMEIILRNIISNAVRYTHPLIATRFIKVEVLVSDYDAQIKIVDNGVGIEKVHLPKIFNMFFRGNEKSTGSGLGLYIAQQAAEKLNGSIQVESEPDKGTVVKLTFQNMVSIH